MALSHWAIIELQQNLSTSTPAWRDYLGRWIAKKWSSKLPVNRIEEIRTCFNWPPALRIDVLSRSRCQSHKMGFTVRRQKVVPQPRNHLYLRGVIPLELPKGRVLYRWPCAQTGTRIVQQQINKDAIPVLKIGTKMATRLLNKTLQITYHGVPYGEV